MIEPRRNPDLEARVLEVLSPSAPQAPHEITRRLGGGVVEGTIIGALQALEKQGLAAKDANRAWTATVQGVTAAFYGGPAITAAGATEGATGTATLDAAVLERLAEVSDGSTFLSIPVLAHELDADVDAVAAALARLADQGLVEEQKTGYGATKEGRDQTDQALTAGLMFVDPEDVALYEVETYNRAVALVASVYGMDPIFVERAHVQAAARGEDPRAIPSQLAQITQGILRDLESERTAIAASVGLPVAEVAEYEQRFRTEWSGLVAALDALTADVPSEPATQQVLTAALRLASTGNQPRARRYLNHAQRQIEATR